MAVSAILSIEYRSGEVEQLQELIHESVDHITSGDSFHLFSDPVEVLIKAWEKLKPGGMFSLLTGFTSSAHSFPDTPHLSTLWPRFLRHSLDIATESNFTAGYKGLEKAKRNPPTKRAFGIDSEALLKQMHALGFTDLQQTSYLTHVPMNSVFDFLSLPGIGSQLLPHYGTNGSNLIFMMASQRLKLESLPRNWVMIKGVKQ